MTKYALIFLFVLCSSCGYTIAEVDSSNESRFVYNLVEIVNLSQDLTISGEVENEVYRTLTIDSESTNYMSIYIRDSSISTDQTGASREAVKSILKLSLQIRVVANDGNVLFDKELSSSQTFTVGNSIASYKMNMLKALDEAIKSVLNRFRYEFETK